ncbi:hypothetical protein Tco_1468566 [Tanacetum coccineum]
MRNKKRSSQAYRPELNFGPRDKSIPPAHQRKGAERITVDLQYLVESESKFRALKQLTCRTRTLMKTMTGASASMIGWAVAMSTAGLDKDAPRVKGAPRVKVLQVRTPRTVGASAAEEYREDEDMSLPWRRQKVDAFTRRISDFSEDKRRRMPANVKTYDGTGHRLNLLKGRSVAKIPVVLARVKQRQGESINCLRRAIRDELHSRQGVTRNSQDSGFYVITTATAGQRGGWGNDHSTPHAMTPKEILATEGSNFPKPPPMRTPEEQRVGNGYCEYHRQKGHTTNECVQLRQLIDKLVKEGRLDHLVKNIKEGKDKQRGGGKKDAPRTRPTPLYGAVMAAEN